MSTLNLSVVGTEITMPDDVLNLRLDIFDLRYANSGYILFNLIKGEKKSSWHGLRHSFDSDVGQGVENTFY